MYQPVKIAQINDLQLGGRDFELVLDKGLLFVAMSEMKIATRLDSYITNVIIKSLMCIMQFTMPWDKKPATSNQVYATVGAVACYKVKLTQVEDEDDNEWEFTKWWIKGYAV